MKTIQASSQPDGLSALSILLEDVETRSYSLERNSNIYRAIVESMNDGVLVLSRDHVILYCNLYFAKMVLRPLEQLIGFSLEDFIAAEDRVTLRGFLELADKDDSEIKLDFQTGIGTLLPAQISIRTPVDSGGRDFTFCIVVTELNEEHPNEGLLRSFSQRLVQVHEAERERVASDLHGHITQLLCAVLVHSEVVTDKLTPRDRGAMIEMKKLRKMIGEAATAVEFISRHLRPSVLDHLGLAAILKSDGTEFSERTGVQLEVASGQLTTRLPPAAELAFYRIFQESLKNVEIHAQAKHVTIQLVQLDDSVEMTIQDDGIGFDPASQNATLGFGLYYMRERAATLGGSVGVTSSYGKGTTVHARIPSGEDPQGL